MTQSNRDRSEERQTQMPSPRATPTPVSMSESERLERIRRAREETRRYMGNVPPAPAPARLPDAPPSPVDITGTSAEQVDLEETQTSQELPAEAVSLGRGTEEAAAGLDREESAERLEEVTAREERRRQAAAAKVRRRDAVRAMLRSRAGLRQAILAQEVLLPPKSLRPDENERWAV